MKITVIGASGRSGRKIVEEALSKSWPVVAFLRNRAKLPIEHPQLTFVEGDVYDTEAIRRAIAGAEAVVSALGQSDISGEVNLMSDGMKNILPAMRLHGVKRVIAIGGMGVLQANEQIFIKDLPEFPAIYKNVSEGHFKVYELLKHADVDWTFLCCPYIPDGEKTGVYQVRKDYMPSGKQQISTGDIAHFVIHELEQNNFLRTRVGISN